MAARCQQILPGQPEFLNWASGPRRGEMALGRVVDLFRFRRKPSFVDLADRARDTGRWELAVQLYRKALDRNPDNPPIWIQYGHALKESGKLRDPDRLAQAEAAYRRALTYNPAVADTHLQLGHALKLQGKTEEAEASYLRAVTLDPSLPYSLQELSGLGWSDAQVAELQGMLANGFFPENCRPATEQACSGHFDAGWYLEQNGDVARAGTDPPEHFLTYGMKESRKPRATAVGGRWNAVTDVEIRCRKKPSLRDEVALFATHSPRGQLKPHVRHYLDSLKRQSIAVILIVNTDRPFAATDTDMVSGADGIFVRRNEGYDFAAWAHILLLHPELFDAKILYLLNDSVIGPANDVAQAPCSVVDRPTQIHRRYRLVQGPRGCH